MRRQLPPQYLLPHYRMEEPVVKWADVVLCMPEKHQWWKKVIQASVRHEGPSDVGRGAVPMVSVRRWSVPTVLL